ncbi:hypothetical protein FSP39_008878 [Pinctada imbricata]|uniref:Reverse transcriptase domain-containing protein n=1 Tax=Pinctada imbricata TaxID=66713 RepID=A0AA89C562_PINIB|nr:hypothetical protein FSP39_008878 [Pinctada imbricata]
MVNEYTVKKWDNEKCEEFIGNLNNDRIGEVMNNLNTLEIENLTETSMNQIVSNVCDIMTDAAKKTFGLSHRRANFRKKNTKMKPWFENDCKMARKRFRKSQRKYKHIRTEENRKEMNLNAKAYKSIMNKSIKKHRKEIKNKMKTLKSKNPKEYWKLIKEKPNKQQGNISIETLYDFFKTLNESENDDEQIPINLEEFYENENLHEIMNARITKDEVVKAIKKLSNNKACGDDNIYNEYIKSSQVKMIEVFIQLFNVILDTGKMPDVWLSGNIIPIFKNKGSKSEAKNYRPITIVSCLGKLFTSILNDRLQRFSEEVTLIGENQTGFRKGYSTVMF